ncbi:hypothetical protein [Bacillus paranthracis]|uniref:hypothetical protein n=1 Tax=Bacillus paranthracis TaxID=2026186 RepID=UPI0022E14D88|nr:hypothetical protein [Bacillus paranthracis]
MSNTNRKFDQLSVAELSVVQAGIHSRIVALTQRSMQYTGSLDTYRDAGEITYIDLTQKLLKQVSFDLEAAYLLLGEVNKEMEIKAKAFAEKVIPPVPKDWNDDRFKLAVDPNYSFTITNLSTGEVREYENSYKEEVIKTGKELLDSNLKTLKELSAEGVDVLPFKESINIDGTSSIVLHLSSYWLKIVSTSFAEGEQG